MNQQQQQVLLNALAQKAAAGAIADIVEHLEKNYSCTQTEALFTAAALISGLPSVVPHEIFQEFLEFVQDHPPHLTKAEIEEALKKAKTNN